MSIKVITRETGNSGVRLGTLPVGTFFRTRETVGPFIVVFVKMIEDSSWVLNLDTKLRHDLPSYTRVFPYDDYDLILYTDRLEERK